MTRNEFIHRAIIAQMANPYAWGSDNNPFRMSFSDIIDAADDMADYVEGSSIPFDALQMEENGEQRDTRLNPEESAINDLDYCIERYKELFRGTPKEIFETKDGQDWYNFMSAKLAKLQERRDKLAKELES